MKTYTDNKQGYKIDLPDDWELNVNNTPIIANLLFRLTYGGPLKNGMEFIHGPNETLNFSIESIPSIVTPEIIQLTFMEYAQREGYSSVKFGRIFVNGKVHPWVRYQMAPNVWSKKYMIILNNVGYAITASFQGNELVAQTESEWDTIVSSLQLI